MKKSTLFLASVITLLIIITGCGVQKEVDYASGKTTTPDLSAIFGSGPYLPDIETFMQIGYCGSPDISPDGRRVFFTSHMSGTDQLYSILDDGWPYQVTMFAEGVDSYLLSHSGDLAIVSADVGGSERSQLFVAETYTGRVKQITDNPESRFIGVMWAPDDKSIYFSSNIENGRDFKLYRMTLGDDEVTRVLDVEGWNGWAASSLDGKKLIHYRYNSNVDDDLFLYDMEAGDDVHLTPHEGDIVYDNIFFSADGSFLYLTCNDNDMGINRRAKMDLATNEITYLDPDSNWEVESVAMSPDRNVMAWVLNEDGYARLKLADMKTGAELPLPKLDGMMNSPVFSETTRMVFTFNSPTQTSNVWSWDWQTEELTQLTTSTYAGIDNSLFREPQLVRYPSFDGLEIPAFIYLPPDYKPGDVVPFILDMHGGPEGQFRPGFNRHFQYLMLHGFGLLAPNIRGSEGYGKEYLAMDNYKNRLLSVKDMKAGVDWLIEQGYTKKGMVGVKGGSYGGYMVMAGITEYPDLFSAAINDVGIVNFVTFLQNTADYRRYLREAEYGPLSDPEFLRSISPIHKANLITTPLMVVHGRNDPRVPVGEAEQIIDAIRRRGGEVKPLIFEDEGHGISKRANRLIYYREMVDFFEKYLK